MLDYEKRKLKRSTTSKWIFNKVEARQIAKILEEARKEYWTNQGVDNEIAITEQRQIEDGTYVAPGKAGINFAVAKDNVRAYR